MIFDVAISITLKPAVDDPQGSVVENELRELGFTTAADVRVGRYIQMTVHADDEPGARAQVAEMCERLLRNPAIEEYRIGLEEQLATGE